ncbi:hypothetical protein HAX54_046207 [Datura stramonium]|uniref:Uncharacterized protein n=1 Tax=Datura stramonium TaxID=4076 RepID=A0ABS8SSX6_DATST|nr:hypothetical protein [Datura stramonium]
MEIKSTKWPKYSGQIVVRVRLLQTAPSKNDHEVPLAREILIASLVTNLCRDAGVPEIERIDEKIWTNQVLDITKIQDEMNPKLKKRKRVPVVCHVSETDMGINSQMVTNMTAWKITRLTLLIEHMPDIIKRAIDKALAPFYVKVQVLEHRVSKLEGIGAREALAALKADMSKVKIDVH